MIKIVKDYLNSRKCDMLKHKLENIYVKETMPIPEVFFVLQTKKLGEIDFNFWEGIIISTNTISKDYNIPVTIGDEEDWKNEPCPFGWVPL